MYAINFFEAVVNKQGTNRNCTALTVCTISLKEIKNIKKPFAYSNLVLYDSSEALD